MEVAVKNLTWAQEGYKTQKYRSVLSNRDIATAVADGDRILELSEKIDTHEAGFPSFNQAAQALRAAPRDGDGPVLGVYETGETVEPVKELSHSKRTEVAVLDLKAWSEQVRSAAIALADEKLTELHAEL